MFGAPAVFPGDGVVEIGLPGGPAASWCPAGPVSGKVTKVDGDKVTVTVEGAVPAWAKKGASVTAAGGSPKVVSVQVVAMSVRSSV